MGNPYAAQSSGATSGVRAVLAVPGLLIKGIVLAPIVVPTAIVGGIAWGVAKIGDGIRHILKPSLWLDKVDISAASNELIAAKTKFARVNATTGVAADVVAAAQADLTNAAQKFNHSTLRSNFTQGKIGASLKGLSFSLKTNLLGMDPAKVMSGHVVDDVAAATERALQTKANIFERIISKPIRVVANHPRIAALAAVGTLVAWLGGKIHDSAAASTQANAMNEVMAAQQQAMSYMNNVSPAEAALLESRMRRDSNGGAGYSHADAYAAAQQQQAAAAQQSA